MSGRPTSGLPADFPQQTQRDGPVAQAGAAAATAAKPKGVDLDAEVIDRFRAGDVEALGAIYDKFSKPVWVVAMSVLHDRQLAEDAMHETFVRLWKRAASFDGHRPMGPWLFTIARRTAVDVHRREHRPTRGDHEQERDDVVVQMPGLDAAWESWEVRLALEELNEEERTIMKLSHFLQMTHVEIAEELQVPVGTVKSRSHRAHRRLAFTLRHLLSESSPRLDQDARPLDLSLSKVHNARPPIEREKP